MIIIAYLFLIFVNTEYFLKIYRDGWQKQNIAIVTFKQASITRRKIMHILHEPSDYRYSTLFELTRRKSMAKIQYSNNNF